MLRPVIGISCYVEQARWGAWDTEAAVLQTSYVRSLTTAGARVVIIPPDSADDVVMDRLDGLILAGGADIDPARYGQTRLDTTDIPRVERDAGEIAVYEGARRRGLPVLGICRGMQMMAVAEGGALHQHLPDLVGTHHRDAPGTFNEHGATFEPGSLVARVIGTTEHRVNSSHHQCVTDPGRLTVTGWADDGTIESLEDPSATFVVGVQWHPEYAGDEVAQRLFGAFVDAARLGLVERTAATAG